MAVEAKRGCGYRKIGGTYLAGGGIGKPCDRLPLELSICPTCGHGIKFSRSWTWVNVNDLVQGPHIVNYERVVTFEGQYSAREKLTAECPENDSCFFCGDPAEIGRAGLLWIGEQFYKTPEEFIIEGQLLGFSRRIKFIPRKFKIGETWVLLAHMKAIRAIIPNADSKELVVSGKLEFRPGIFYVWMPQRIEKIMLESQQNSEEATANEKRGITNVFVPDNDPDHCNGDVEEKQKEMFTEEE